MGNREGGSKMNILLVDDNAEILDILTHHLERQNYTVYAAQSAEQAWEIIRSRRVDLAILDVMLPGTDGYELCRKIRASYFFPVLFLTAKSREDDKIKGLTRCGADDYMVKPFSAAELLARVSTLIRRSTVYNPAEKGKTLRHKTRKLLLDESTGAVEVAGARLDLTDLEYKLLLLLLRNKGKELTVEFIFQEIWKEVFLKTSKNTVVVHIRNLRKKISRHDAGAEYIRTVWGKGYAIF